MCSTLVANVLEILHSVVDTQVIAGEDRDVRARGQIGDRDRETCGRHLLALTIGHIDRPRLCGVGGDPWTDDVPVRSPRRVPKVAGCPPVDERLAPTRRRVERARSVGSEQHLVDHLPRRRLILIDLRHEPDCIVDTDGEARRWFGEISRPGAGKCIASGRSEDLRGDARGHLQVDVPKDTQGLIGRESDDASVSFGSALALKQRKVWKAMANPRSLSSRPEIVLEFKNTAQAAGIPIWR